MANLCAIVAPSGSGKSTSVFPNAELKIKGLDPSETVIVNVSGKPLPVRGGNKLYPIGTKISEGARQIITKDAKMIASMITAIDQNIPQIKNIVVDDAQYIQAFMYMNKAKESGYAKFNEIGEAGFLPIKAASEAKRNNLNIFFIYHEEVDRSGIRKIKTAGQMIDQYVTVEGLFTVVLFAHVEVDPIERVTQYSFRTNTDGTNTAKSPAGMFGETFIPNDLGLVAEKMLDYYNG